ncbi:MAG: hypothetical protein ACRDLD_02320 [Thermoleophilaceae bacterium]
MTDEEKQERGFGACGICAIACPQDHPEAQAGWRLECGEGPNALTAPS